MVFIWNMYWKKKKIKIKRLKSVQILASARNNTSASLMSSSVCSGSSVKCRPRLEWKCGSSESSVILMSDHPGEQQVRCPHPESQHNIQPGQTADRWHGGWHHTEVTAGVWGQDRCQQGNCSADKTWQETVRQRFNWPHCLPIINRHWRLCCTRVIWMNVTVWPSRPVTGSVTAQF